MVKLLEPEYVYGLGRWQCPYCGEYFDYRDDAEEHIEELCMDVYE